jgi:hypothetical protein
MDQHPNQGSNAPSEYNASETGMDPAVMSHWAGKQSSRRNLVEGGPIGKISRVILRTGIRADPGSGGGGAAGLQI